MPPQRAKTELISQPRRALRCDERYVPALRALVKASLAQDRKELAASILANALSAAPNDAEPWMREEMEPTVGDEPMTNLPK